MSTSAQAETPAVGDAAAESRLHFDRGVALYREGSLDAAYAEFLRAFELTRDYRLLYNLAQVQAERHDYARAIPLLTEYLERGAALSPERRSNVDNELARMRQRVGELWVSANVPGAEVWIGERLAAHLPLETPILVNAGPTIVRVVEVGYEPIIRELAVAGGDRPRLDLQLTLEAPVAGPPPARVVDRTALWVSVSATTGFTVGWLVFGVLASKADGELDDELDTYPSNTARIDDARSSVSTNAAVSDVFGGVALIAAGASLYFLLNPSYEEAPARAAPSDGGRAARIVLSPTGLLLDGSF